MMNWLKKVVIQTNDTSDFAKKAKMILLMSQKNRFWWKTKKNQQ